MDKLLLTCVRSSYKLLFLIDWLMQMPCWVCWSRYRDGKNWTGSFVLDWFILLLLSGGEQLSSGFLLCLCLVFCDSGLRPHTVWTVYANVTNAMWQNFCLNDDTVICTSLFWYVNNCKTPIKQSLLFCTPFFLSHCSGFSSLSSPSQPLILFKHWGLYWVIDFQLKPFA